MTLGCSPYAVRICSETRVHSHGLKKKKLTIVTQGKMDIKNWCSGMYVALYSPLVTEKLHDFGKITIALCLTFLRKIGVIHVFPGLLGGFGEGRGAVLGTQRSFSEGSLPAPLPRAGSQQTEHTDGRQKMLPWGPEAGQLHSPPPNAQGGPEIQPFIL